MFFPNTAFIANVTLQVNEVNMTTNTTSGNLTCCTANTQGESLTFDVGLTLRVKTLKKHFPSKIGQCNVLLFTVRNIHAGKKLTGYCTANTSSVIEIQRSTKILKGELLESFEGPSQKYAEPKRTK